MLYDIATLTMNPALDRTIVFETELFIPGNLHRVSKGSVYENAGGKGINVARVLKKLGTDAKAYCFTGGRNGERLKELLKAEKINGVYIESQAETRMNIKIIDKASVCTEINENGGPVTDSELGELLKIHRKSTGNPQAFIIAGSIPQGVEKSVYKLLITMWKKCGSYTVLDCDGEALRHGIEGKPDLIKPNQNELSQLVGTDVSTPEKAVEKAKELYTAYGVEILCTLCGKGAVFAGAEGLWKVNSPQVTVRGFSGAGDTFLAAFLYERYNTGSVPQALRFAASAAAVKVEKYGTEIPDFAEMKKYTGVVTTEKID